MFMLSMGVGQVLGFPDVCLTPLGPVPAPIPYPNLSQSAMAPTSVMNVLCSCTPTLNMASTVVMSNGNQPGTLTGVVSHMIMGQTNWILGSLTCFVGGAPVQRMTSITTCNCMGMTPNGPGVCLVPSQPRVIVLA